MNDVMDALLADAEAPREIPSDEKLALVRAAAELKLSLEDQLLKKEAEAGVIAAQLDEVTKKTLPDLFRELGIKEIKLLSGRVVEITKKYYGSISEKNADLAFKWLRKNGHGGLIKNVLKIEFGKDEDDLARRFVASLKRRAVEPNWSRKEAVHPMTLGAFVKEQREAGAQLPEDLLGVHVEDVAKIK